MVDKVLAMICEVVQGIDTQVISFFKDNFDTKNETLSISPIHHTTLQFPLKITYLLKPENKLLYSLEFMKFLHFTSDEFNGLQTYANKNNLSVQEALLQVFQTIISNHKATKSIQKSYSSKGHVEVEINLWRNMEWQELTKTK